MVTESAHAVTDNASAATPCVTYTHSSGDDMNENDGVPRPALTPYRNPSPRTRLNGQFDSARVEPRSCQSRRSTKATKGYMVDVKDYSVDAKGYVVDVKGYSVDAKASPLPPQ
eukprot:1804811-Pyramimonas_sp.AAC.1